MAPKHSADTAGVDKAKRKSSLPTQRMMRDCFKILMTYISNHDSLIWGAAKVLKSRVEKSCLWFSHNFSLAA
ncbi:hypothetical protein E2C01_038977 [Portunus trituberculatus]|uniref:Uncharacterized protein n=1 Tax=Portunus trituberculatus TaxID=210409 RepID=A0A5B7FJG4_PORTR|nr:hypothetical protein [Portunus trituberculatus]